MACISRQPLLLAQFPGPSVFPACRIHQPQSARGNRGGTCGARAADASCGQCLLSLGGSPFDPIELYHGS